jgi:phosphotransferase system HPr-like phosphotransfer protein
MHECNQKSIRVKVMINAYSGSFVSMSIAVIAILALSFMRNMEVEIEVNDPRGKNACGTLRNVFRQHVFEFLPQCRGLHAEN